MRTQNKKLINGALLLSISAFIAKLLGAVNRIFLSPIIGSKGLGIYQMIFPVYVLILDFSGLAAPNAIAKLISNNKKDFSSKNYLTASIKIFGAIGLLGTIIMAVFSKTFSILQGNEKAYLGYVFLSPGVVFVSIISCFRGYFQGKLKMFPTALSQIIEQVIKLVFGIILAGLFMPNIEMAVGGVTLAITISELVALIYLFLSYLAQGKEKPLPLSFIERKNISKKIIKTTLPIMSMGLIIPLSQIIDSFIALNILNKFTDNATSLYGLFSGAVMTIINLPITIIYSLAVVCVPTVSSAKDNTEKNKIIQKTILLTFVFSLLASLLTYYFSPFIVGTLFGSFNNSEKSLVISMLKLAVPVIIFMSVLQTQNSALIALGRAKVANVNLLIGVIIKSILAFKLISERNINIFGSVISLIACYFCASLLNFIMLIVLRERNEIKKFNVKRQTN